MAQPNDQSMTPIQQLIAEECDGIKQLLLRKNREYNSSFSSPLKIFSRFSAEEQVNVRIDDKLKRIANWRTEKTIPEDTEQDLIGYLILKRVLRRLDNIENERNPHHDLS